MLDIEWWHDATYGHIWQLAASGFAWEYLRRNDEYRQDCQTLALIGRQNANQLKSFAHRWGCCFPSDPDTAADLQAPLWSPRLYANAFMLLPVAHVIDADGPTIKLAHLDGLDLRRTTDGWHGIWRADGIAHQLWLPRAAPDAATFYGTFLPSDAFYELRSLAARRFWRSVAGRPPGPEFRAMPAQLRQWHVLSLRALDARLHGDSYRTIAKVLLGFSGTKEDWEVDPRKNKARRLVAHAMKMMRGGYRQLLHYPIKTGGH